MKKLTALFIGLLILALCIVLLGRLARTPAPHTVPSWTEAMPAQPGEGPAGLPTPTV